MSNSIFARRPFSQSPEVTVTLSGHNGTVRALKFRRGTGGDAVLASVGAGDCAVRLWDVRGGTLAIFALSDIHWIILMPSVYI